MKALVTLEFWSEPFSVRFKLIGVYCSLLTLLCFKNILHKSGYKMPEIIMNVIANIYYVRYCMMFEYLICISLGRQSDIRNPPIWFLFYFFWYLISHTLTCTYRFLLRLLLHIRSLVVSFYASYQCAYFHNRYSPFHSLIILTMCISLVQNRKLNP